MKRITLLFIVLLTTLFIACGDGGDEGIILGTQSPTAFATLKGYDNAPGAPSLIPEIPTDAITRVEHSYNREDGNLTLRAYALYNDVEYIYEVVRAITWVENHEGTRIVVRWTSGNDYIIYRVYDSDNEPIGNWRRHTINPNNFQLAIPVDEPETPQETEPETPVEQPAVNPNPTPVNPNPNPTPVYVPPSQIEILSVSQRGDSFTFNMRLLDREAESYVISCGDAVPRRITYNQHPNEPYNEHGSWFGKGTPGKAGYLDLVPYDTYTIRVEVMDDPNISDELTFRYDDHKHGADADLVDQVKQQGGKTWHTHGSGWHSHGVGSYRYDVNGNYVDPE